MAEKNTKGIWEKIMNVQQGIKAARKAGTNEHNKFKYAREGDIIEAVKPLLGVERLAVFQTTKSHVQKEKKITVCVNFTLVNVDNPSEQLPSEVYGEGEDKAGSVVGTPIAYTMALKYFLAKTFMVETWDDAEFAKKNARANETPDQKFEKAKNMILKAKGNDVAGLIEYAQTKLKTASFSDKQKKELNDLISKKADEKKN